MIGIYKITNKINNKIYIGQSTNVEYRFKSHIAAALNQNSQAIIHKAIRKYGIENFSFEIIEQCKENELNTKEMQWIKFYDSYNSGYNATIGGDGRRLITEDQHYLMVELFNQGILIKNIAPIVGVEQQAVSKYLHSLNMYSDYNTPKPVQQINPKTLEVIREFPSIESVKSFGFNRSSVAAAANGQRSQADGFFWKYADDINWEPPKEYKKNKYSIEQINKNNLQVIQEFESAAKASKALKIDASSITAVCKGRRKTAGGFMWRYKEE